MHTLKLKFYFKSCSAVYFFKDILNKAFHGFSCQFFTHQKQIHYIKCFSQVAAKHAKDKLQIKKNVMCKRPQSNQNNFFNSNNIKQMLRLYFTSFRGIFRTHLSIFDRVFWKKLLAIFTKKPHHRCFLNILLNLYAVIGSVSWLQRQSKSNLRLVLKI